MANKTIRAMLTALLLCGCNSPVGSDPSGGDDAALNEALYANLDATDSGSSVASAGNAIDAKTMADMNLKALLKDPDSAKFRKVVVTKIPGGNLMLCGEVNSKNAFGGYTGFKRFIASPNPDAPSIIEGEMPGVTKATFSEAYASACSNVVERFS